MAEHSGKGTESKNPEELDEDIFWLQRRSKDAKGKGGRQGVSNGVFPIYRLAAVPDDDGQEHALARGGWWAVIWWWRVAGGRRLVAGGWRLVAGGVADGWWLMAGGWRLVA